jgi:predicted GNAT superfamily acetyltransferase
MEFFPVQTRLILLQKLLDNSTMIIREIDSISEMKALEKLQKKVWGWDDLDTMPLMNFIVMKEVGGSLIGAFDRETPVGFVFGFVGCDEGTIVFHSHMLAVLPEFRSQGIGRKLKLAQREQALRKGFNCITWTFDPLQSPNAYLNFSRLGVIATKYKVNFYGEQTSSALHQYIGTDRLWVSWFLESERVRQRLECGSNAKTGPTDLQELTSLVQTGRDGWPQSTPLSERVKGPVLIDIPPDIRLLQQQNPQLAVAWRDATRSAFTEALAAGFIVEDFYRSHRQGESAGCYLLSSKMPDGINHHSN